MRPAPPQPSAAPTAKRSPPHSRMSPVMRMTPALPYRGGGLCRPLPRHALGSGRAAARPSGRAGAHLRSAGGAASEHRPRGPGRPGRGGVAAGDALRSLAQPPHARRAGPRSAGAEDLAVRPRFRPGAGRGRGHPGPIPPSSPARPPLPRASCRGWRRWSAKIVGAGARRTARDISPGGARSIVPLRSSASTGQGRCPRAPRARLALSVTEIETWLRDPYAIYARHILGLRELDPVDLPPGAADRGIIIHGALSEFTKTFETNCLPIPRSAHRDRSAGTSPPSKDLPRHARSGGRASNALRAGSRAWEMQRRRGHLRAFGGDPREDRVPDGRARVHAARPRRPHRAARRRPLRDPRLQDRQVPTDKQVRIGLSPQLTLEAAMLRGGGFPGPAEAPPSPSSSTWRSRAASRRARSE